jgi:TPR repeat protein
LSSEPQSEGQYLLDDDSSSRSGLRKLVLLAVLAAIIGLVYAQWRANTAANPKSPEPPKRQPASVPRPQGNNLQPKIDTQEKESVKEASSQNVTNKKVDRQETPQAVAAAELAKPPQKEQQQDDNATTAEDTATEARTVDSKIGRQSGPRKSKAVPMMREQPSIALVKAQRYLQGRGVPQNCEQGLLYLKAATRENDPNAAVQMAALYASGHCVQQNRVKAYQWFSSAHDLKPENQWIAKNMDQLWAQMTQQERRQFQ